MNSTLLLYWLKLVHTATRQAPHPASPQQTKEVRLPNPVEKTTKQDLRGKKQTDYFELGIYISNDAIKVNKSYRMARI